MRCRDFHPNVTSDAASSIASVVGRKLLLHLQRDFHPNSFLLFFFSGLSLNRAGTCDERPCGDARVGWTCSSETNAVSATYCPKRFFLHQTLRSLGATNSQSSQPSSSYPKPMRSRMAHFRRPPPSSSRIEKYRSMVSSPLARIGSCSISW